MPPLLRDVPEEQERGRLMSLSVATVPVDGIPAPARTAAVVAVSAAVGMATLDTAIVNTALPTIADTIGASAASSIWVVNAYQLAVVAALLPLAALGDIIGHRRIFIGGLIVFTITSLGCGLAWSLPTLVAARAAQGLGAAGIMAVNVALIRHVYPKNILGRGLGYNALVVALAFTIGPTAASAILSVATWHWLFLVNVPTGLIALVLAWRAIPVTGKAARRFDPIASLLCAACFSLVIMGFGAVAHQESWTVVALQWAGALICGIALLRWEAGRPVPLLAFDLFRRPVFALSAATSICSFATQGLAFVALPFLLQSVLGYTQVHTGFLITPWPVVVAVMAPIAGRLSDRYPVGLLASGGLVLLSLGMAAMALLPNNPTTIDITWRMVLCGIGFGFFQSPNLRAMMSSAPPDRSGGASGIVATSRLLGQTIGAATVALCLTLSGSAGPILALWIGCLFAGIGSVASVLRLRPERTPTT